MKYDVVRVVDGAVLATVSTMEKANAMAEKFGNAGVTVTVAAR
jgi:hypothetical protein